MTQAIFKTFALKVLQLNFVYCFKRQKQPPEVLYKKKVFLKISQRPVTLLKKRLWHKCFPVNFAKFLRTPFHRTPPDDCF